MTRVDRMTQLRDPRHTDFASEPGEPRSEGYRQCGARELSELGLALLGRQPAVGWTTDHVADGDAEYAQQQVNDVVHDRVLARQ